MSYYFQFRSSKHVFSRHSTFMLSRLLEIFSVGDSFMQYSLQKVNFDDFQSH